MRIVAIGGSDAGISAALPAREVDPGAEVTVVVTDAPPLGSPWDAVQLGAQAWARHPGAQRTR